MAYSFFLVSNDKKVQFPVAPSELTINVKGRNETIDLMNEGEVNLLKSPGLTEVSFKALIPHPQLGKYPFAVNSEPIDTFTNFLNDMLETKTPFRFVVVRTAGTKLLFDTNLRVSCEGYDLEESADNGFDVYLNVSLKQYRDFGVKTIKLVSIQTTQQADTTTTTTTTTTSSTTTTTTTKTTTSSSTPSKSSTTTAASTSTTRPSNYSGSSDNGSSSSSSSKKSGKNTTVKSGDTLWDLAKKYYGDGSKWKTIYNANKSTIESEAKDHGKKSSSNGHWIYPGTKLKIP